MRILHYYDKNDTMVSQHVKMLNDSMGLEAENHIATESEQARTLLRGGHYDILHLHGCWRNSSRGIVNLAFRQGTRLVITPHGQLEPWVQQENRWKEKLPKRVFYQRRIVAHAYAVIVQGSMEQECMQHLGWNTRTVIIRNAVITHTITPADMARTTFTLYRKIIDSNTLELMNDDTRTLLRHLITAGITGDRRWVDITEPLPSPSSDEWRLLLCYAHQEQIMDTIQRGIRVLALNAPDLDTSQIDYFVPDGFKHADSIQKAIGNEFPTENHRLMATFRYLRRITANKQLGIKHLIELNRELRGYGCEEEELADDLGDHRLLKLASRLMQLMADYTGLTEGFMPVPPVDNRYTRHLRRQIEHHLKV